MILRGRSTATTFPPYDTLVDAQRDALEGLAYNWPDRTRGELRELLEAEPEFESSHETSDSDGPANSEMSPANTLPPVWRFDDSERSSKLSYQVWVSLDRWCTDPEALYETLPLVGQIHYERSPEIRAAFLRVIATSAAVLIEELRALMGGREVRAQTTLDDLMLWTAIRAALENPADVDMFPALSKFPDDITDEQVASMKGLLHDRDIERIWGLTIDEIDDEQALQTENRSHWAPARWTGRISPASHPYNA